MLEEQNLSRERQAHAASVPGAISDIGLLDEEVSALVQVSENAPAEGNFFGQGAVDPGNTISVGIDQQHALHARQDLLHAGRRHVMRVGAEAQAYQFIALLSYSGRSRLGSVVLKEEGVGYGTHDAGDAVGIFLLLLALFAEFVGISSVAVQ